MGALTPSDVKRWDVNAIHAVFQTASGRAATLQRLGENLSQVHSVLADWQGEAGEAFRVDLGKARRDIEADGAESEQMAAAVSRAEADVSACKAELDDIGRAADSYGWTITPDWRIDVGNTGIGLDPISFAAEQQVLQAEIDACKAHSHTADHELASAIRGAVGEVQVDAGGNPPGGAPPAQSPPKPASGKPQSLQDMLLPTGAGSDDPARMPRSLEDMLMGSRQPTDQQPLPGSLPDLLSRLQQPVAAGAPQPPLKPGDVESFKAMLRPIMARNGVPPDQIEAQLDSAVARAQTWLNAGMPNAVPAAPPSQPPPGFGEGFGDRWFAAEQSIKDLTGQEGLSALGDSWGGMAKGLVQKAGEFATQGPVVSGINDLTRDFQNFLDSPSAAYYAGEKGADGAITLPGLLFGGEGAAVGELGEFDAAAAYDGLKPLPHSPIGLDGPIYHHPWDPSAGQDLYGAFAHGEPTAGLSQQIADISTHYIDDNPDRVVLGKWDGDEAGYIGEARAQGGIYYDTGPETWDAMTYGLSDADQTALAWQPNEHFLRSQMENGVPRIEYVLGDYSSIEEVLLKRQGSFSAREIEFLNDNAPAYGYRRVGNAWVKD